MLKTDIILQPSAILAFARAAPHILLTILMILLSWWLSPCFLIFALAALFAAWYRFLALRSHRYLITPDLIRLSRGVLYKRTDQVEMFRIKDYIILQPPLLRVFRLMNLVLSGTDPEKPVISMFGIPESDITDTIRDHVLQARIKNNIVELN